MRSDWQAWRNWAGAVAGAVVGEQGAHADAVGERRSGGPRQESDSGFGLLIGQHLGEGQAGVIVDGHMQGQEAGMFVLAAQAAVAAQADLQEAGHAFDIEMQQIAGTGMLVAQYGRRRDSDRASG